MKLETNQVLNYYLSKRTIPQLKTIANTWDLKGISSLKKADLVAKLENCIKENIIENLQSLPTQTHDIISSLVQNNGMIKISQSNESYDILESKGIIHKEIENDEIIYLLSTDIANKFSIDIADEVAATIESEQPILSRTPRRVVKVSRNDKCPCGSDIKYKFCCGK